MMRKERGHVYFGICDDEVLHQSSFLGDTSSDDLLVVYLTNVVGFFSILVFFSFLVDSFEPRVLWIQGLV